MDPDLKEPSPNPSSHGPESETVDRIVRAVSGRIARRRRRIRVARWAAAALIASGLALGFLVRHRPGAVEAPEVTGAPATTPAESPASGADSSPPRRVARSSDPDARRPIRPPSPPCRIAAGDLWSRCAALAGAESLESPLGRLVELLETELASMDDATAARAVRELGERIRNGRIGAAERALLVDALPLCRTSRAWPLLAAILDARGPEPAALRAAGLLGDPRAVARLGRWLFLGDERGEAAARALGRIPGRESLVALLEASHILRSGGSLYVPQAAREIWGALSEREDELRAYLSEAPSRHRGLAQRALERLQRDTISLWAHRNTRISPRHKDTSS